MLKSKRKPKSTANLQDAYQAEIDDILDTLKHIEETWKLIRAPLQDFLKLCLKYKSEYTPLRYQQGIIPHITAPVLKPRIERKAIRGGTFHVYIDDHQFLETKDEITAEFLELLLLRRIKDLEGISPEKLSSSIHLPKDRNIMVKIIGEHVILQMKEKELLAEEQELLERLEEIVWDAWKVRAKDWKKE
jgi:hypothetical protein